MPRMKKAAKTAETGRENKQRMNAEKIGRAASASRMADAIRAAKEQRDFEEKELADRREEAFKRLKDSQRIGRILRTEEAEKAAAEEQERFNRLFASSAVPGEGMAPSVIYKAQDVAGMVGKAQKKIFVLVEQSGNLFKAVTSERESKIWTRAGGKSVPMFLDEVI